MYEYKEVEKETALLKRLLPGNEIGQQWGLRMTPFGYAPLLSASITL